jgi:hypothetical protein
VTRLNAGSGITLTGNTGQVTISSTGGGGGVTSVGISSSQLVVTGSPVVGAGVIGVNLPANLSIANNITAGGVFSGNGSGLTNLPVANITGLGNVALLNRDGNGSNVLFGNGVFASAVTVPGATGATGATGIGATGATGIGATGATGIGATGATGIGATGATGIGATGATGIGATGATGPVAGTNTQIIFNDSSIANGSANLTFNKTTNILTVTGNITAGNANVTGQLISTVATGTAPLVVTSTTQVANLSVATSGSATTAGTVTTAAQPNITSVGTLTALAVTGDITSNNVVANNIIRTKPITFSSLPAAATAGTGARSFITDANLAAATNFAAQVEGGGSNRVPVYSDGTDWRIG